MDPAFEKKEENYSPTPKEAEIKWLLLIQYIKNIGQNRVAESWKSKGWSKIQNLNFGMVGIGDGGIKIVGEIYCPQLTYLNFYRNFLTNVDSLHHGTWPQLLVLSLCCNELTSIENLRKGNWPHLRELDLSQNQLVNINNLDKGKWPQLQALYMHKNQLISVDNLQWADWPHFRMINLVNNKLSNVNNLLKVNWAQLQSKNLQIELNRIVNQASVKENRFKFPV